MCGTGRKTDKEINETEQHPEVHPHIYGQRRCKSHSVEKGWSFQPMVLEQSDIHM